MTLAHYTLLPWYRTGLSSAIDSNPADNLDRGQIAVTLQTKVGANAEDAPAQQVRLIGPGDIIGIDARAVVRMEPRPYANDFEPNYMASIEFFDEDFPWRYSPRAPDGAGKTRLHPWLALLVLADGEFTWQDQGEGLPRAIKVDAAILPPAKDAWAWAHAHLSGIAADTAHPGALLNALHADPASGCSRIIAARRLHPNMSYHAMLVPSFEAGRRAGLLPGAMPDRPFAWDAAGDALLPVYFEWTFRTGEAGDFETLARRLEPKAPDPSVGKRPMDVSRPLEGMATPPIFNAANPSKSTLDLEGALRLPGATSSPWPAASRNPFQSWLADFINLGETWTISATGAIAGAPQLPNDTKLPIVLPPAYGRWHANHPTLDVTKADSHWLEQINLDPRNRVAAAFGTLVVQKNQEDFMARAWAQYGEIFRVNRFRYRAQFMREMLTALDLKHLAPLELSRLVATTSLAHARVRATSDASLSIRGLIEASVLPSATVQPVTRRVLRSGGALARRFGTATPQLSTLIANVASARHAVAPAWQQPAERFSLAARPSRYESGTPVAWLGNDWDELRPLLVGLLEIVKKLVDRMRELHDVELLLIALIARGDNQHVISASQLTPAIVRLVDARAAWIPPTFVEQGIPVRPEDSAPAAQALNFSFAAWNFRQSALNNTEWLQIALPDPVVRPVLDLSATASTLRSQLSPYASVRERVERLVHLPDPVKVAHYDPLETIMAHPTFDDATYEHLRKISQDYVVPNLSKIPDNSITLLEANWNFIESFLVGLNHEMSRELLWRGYKTDQRGTYFSHFWDRRGVPGGAQGDIEPIHGWKLGGQLTPLGGNRPELQEIHNNLVLVVRGDLLRRYPNTQVYAVRAVSNTPRRKDFNHVSRRPADESALTVKQPVLFAQFDPDVYCFGFDLDKDQARGNLPPEPTALGWYFVLAERFGEPRFGLDEPTSVEPWTPPPTRAVSQDLTWANLATSLVMFQSMQAIDLSKHAPTSPPRGFQIDPVTASPQRFASWNTDSADMAAILLQTPFRMYFHANNMLLP